MGWQFNKIIVPNTLADLQGRAADAYRMPLQNLITNYFFLNNYLKDMTTAAS